MICTMGVVRESRGNLTGRSGKIGNVVLQSDPVNTWLKGLRDEKFSQKIHFSRMIFGLLTKYPVKNHALFQIKQADLSGFCIILQHF